MNVISTTSNFAGKVLFALVALPAIVRASLRLTYLNRRHELDELAHRMASVRPWSLPWLSHPRYLEASVHRFAGQLPPRGLGPCLKRSLLLLDLWSRCGLEPRIHIGAAKMSGDQPSFHAWTTRPGNEAVPRAAGQPYAELWSYSADSPSSDPLEPLPSRSDIGS